MKPGYFIVLIFILIFFPDFLWAQASDSIHSQQINEIKVTTRIKPSSALSASPLQVVTSIDIDRLGIQSVSDAIRRMNGILIKDYGGIGGFKAIAIRGNGAEHTAVLYDGIAISNVQSGQIDIGQFSLENVDMLSMVIGQNDNIFLTAKSLASVGVLEITTKAPDFTNKRYQGQAQIKTGSWGLFNPYLYYAYKISDKFSLSADGSWLRSDGKYPFERKNATEIIKTKRKNTDVNNIRSEINLFGTLSNTQKISFKAYYYDSERGLPGAFILYNDYSKERLWDKNFFTQAKYLNNINEKFDLQILGKYSHSYTKYTDQDPKYPDGTLENRYNQNELYTNASLLYKLSDHISFSIAEDFSYNTLRANFSGFAKPERYSFLSAVSTKYETKRLTVTGSILGTFMTENVKTGKAPEDRKKISPSVSLSFRPFISTNLRLRASYKDIFRVPTFNDVYYIRIGNKNLVPEKARQLNVGITWTSSFSETFNFFRITGDFFRNSVKDKIVVYPTTFEPKMVNLGKVKITGFDLSVLTQISMAENTKFVLTGNYSYQKAIDITDKSDKNYKDQIPYTPIHSGSASASIENPWINFSYSLVLASKSYSSTSNNDWGEIKGHSDHIISLNKTFILKNYKLRFQADITNFTNKTYYIVKDYPMPGRAYNISAKILF